MTVYFDKYFVRCFAGYWFLSAIYEYDRDKCIYSLVNYAYKCCKLQHLVMRFTFNCAVAFSLFRKTIMSIRIALTYFHLCEMPSQSVLLANLIY